MKPQYLNTDHLAEMSEEALLDLLAVYRTMLQELDRNASKESEERKLEIRRAMEIVETEIRRRELAAQT